jgi:hypothetical protein
MNVKKSAPEIVVEDKPFAVPHGHRALLLVPCEEGPQGRVAELLEQVNLFAPDEEQRKILGLPKVMSQIKLRKLQETDVLFTAIALVGKLDKRKQPTDYKLKVSKGVPVGKFMVGDDEDSEPNYGAIIDAVQASALPMVCRVSEDKILQLRTV